MNRRIATVMAVFTILFGCAKKDTQPGLAQQFLRIEEIRSGRPVNFQLMKAAYTGGLAAYVRSRNSHDHDAIVGALHAGADGDPGEALIESQVVSKTLQKVFFTHLTALVDAALDGNPLRSDSLALLYECLSPTVVRRSVWVGKGRDFDDACRASLALLADGSRTGQHPARLTDLRNRLLGVYALSVLYELDGIEKNRGRDTLVCREKLVEGMIFFETVKPFITSDPPRSRIQEQFAAGYEAMDIEATRAALYEAFDGLDLPALVMAAQAHK